MAVVVFALASLSCSVFVGGPTYEATAIPASPDSNGGLPERIQGAVTAAAPGGQLKFEISEGQLTSYVSQKLGELPNPLITDPQVLLRDGQVTVYGTAQSGLLTATIRISLRISADESGQPRIEITQTDFGPFPVPQGLNAAVSSMMQEALTGALGPVATGFRLDSITVRDGVMTLTGRLK